MRQRPTASSGTPGRRKSSTRTAGVSVQATSWEITSDEDDTNTTLRLEPSAGSSRRYPLHQPPDVASLSYSDMPGSYNMTQTPQHSGNQFSRYPTKPQHPTFTSYRTPNFIPDRSYQTYLSGRPASRKPPILNGICCARFCAIFSLIAVMFLVFIGILLDTQPMYIRGTLPKSIVYEEGSNKARIAYTTALSERLPTASTAYQTAFVYLLTALACLAYANNWFWRLKLRWGLYDSIPDNESVVPTFHGEFDSPGGSQAYQLKNRVGTQIRRLFYVCYRKASELFGNFWAGGNRRRRPRRKRGTLAKEV